MKYILFFVLFLLLSSCTWPNSSQLDYGATKVIEVDSCEYVVYKCGYGAGIVHKGNCKNPIHYGD